MESTEAMVEQKTGEQIDGLHTLVGEHLEVST